MVKPYHEGRSMKKGDLHEEADKIIRINLLSECIYFWWRVRDHLIDEEEICG